MYDLLIPIIFTTIIGIVMIRVGINAVKNKYIYLYAHSVDSIVKDEGLRVSGDHAVLLGKSLIILGGILLGGCCIGFVKNFL